LPPHTPPPPSPQPSPPGAEVIATFKLNVVSEDLAPGFAAQVEAKLALFLDIDAERVQVISVIAGSTIIQARIWEASDTFVRRALRGASIFTLLSVLSHEVLELPTVESSVPPSPPPASASSSGGGGGSGGSGENLPPSGTLSVGLGARSVTAIAVPILLSAVLLTCLCWRWRGLRSRSRKVTVVKQALQSTRSFGFPLHLLRAETFLGMRELTRFEKARDESQHVVVDLVDDAARWFGPAGNRRLIFVSHQWLSFAAPDPMSAQWEAMKAGVRHVVETNDWAFDRVYIWV
jgi:hypothetical protein